MVQDRKKMSKNLIVQSFLSLWLKLRGGRKKFKVGWISPEGLHCKNLEKKAEYFKCKS